MWLRSALHVTPGKVLSFTAHPTPQCRGRPSFVGPQTGTHRTSKRRRGDGCLRPISVHKEVARFFGFVGDVFWERLRQLLPTMRLMCLGDMKSQDPIFPTYHATRLFVTTVRKQNDRQGCHIFGLKFDSIACTCPALNQQPKSGSRKT